MWVEYCHHAPTSWGRSAGGCHLVPHLTALGALTALRTSAALRTRIRASRRAEGQSCEHQTERERQAKGRHASRLRVSPAAMGHFVSCGKNGRGHVHANLPRGSTSLAWPADRAASFRRDDANRSWCGRGLESAHVDLGDMSLEVRRGRRVALRARSREPAPHDLPLGLAPFSSSFGGQYSLESRTPSEESKPRHVRSLRTDLHVYVLLSHAPWELRCRRVGAED
jgi:hypothetical protein